MSDKKIRLVFTGDLLPADREHSPGIGVGSRIARGESLWSGEIRDLFLSADMSVVNLEAPLVNVTAESNKAAFAGKPEILEMFNRSGITHAHVANNHILEHGEENWHNTLSLLREKGVEPVGFQENQKSKIVVKQKQGLTIALAGFNAIHDIANPGCYAELTEEAVLTALQHPHMQKADIRVLMFHWGHEYIHIPSWEQRQLARRCIDAGANIIIGHHPHVIQPVEEYNKGLICYSLGNFLFDMLWSKNVRTGLIIEIEIEKDKSFGWKMHPCRYDKNLQVHLLRDQWTQKRLKKWQYKMDALVAKGEQAYKKAYNRELKINRFLARLQMKKQLLMQLPWMTSANRKEVLNSLFGKIKGTSKT